MKNTEEQTILLIEDNLGDSRLIKEMLKEITSINYRLIIAETLKEGCEQIKKNDFILILLDLNLPDSSGIKTFYTVINFAQKIPVVLVSGMQDVELSLSLIKEGAQDYITKQDLNSTLLGKTIQFAIERKKLLSELIIANKAILQSEENFHRSISESPLGIRIISIEGETIYVNKAFLDIYEYNSLEEFRSIPAINRYTPESYTQNQIRKEKIKNGHDIFDYELSIVSRNAEVRYVKVWRKEVLWNGVKHYQVIIIDITERKLAAETLVKLEKAIYTSGEAIFLTDREGIFTFVNPAFTSLYGFSSDEVIGKVTPRIIKSGVLDKSVYEGFWQTLLNGDEVRGELINKRKDGTTINIEGFATPFIDEEKNIIGFLGSQRDITERKQAEEALNNSQQELRKFATHLQHVREEEKIALAREIHDDLGQILVALKINLGLFKKKISKGIEVISSEEILSEFDQLSNLVDNTIKTTRRIMNGLRPELIELLGFEAACKSYLHDFDETHHISSQFESTILNLNINLERSVALFRILQEALNNIIKHAKATLVTVQLSNPAGKLVMVIVDNGVGFDENNKGRQDSYGLIGMKERVFLLEGELNITSKVGKGTSVRVEIPYSDTISDAEQLEIEY